MSDPTLNSPISFDPVTSEIPEGILLPPERGGEVVALLIDAGTGMAGWPLRVARAIARNWSRHGREVVLVDAHVEAPALHQLLNTTNGEGLADAIEFGASSTRVTRTLEGEPFSFVSAGTVLPHHGEFWRSRRWGAFLDGYRENDRVTLLYLPASDPQIAKVVAASDRAFWVGRSDAPDVAARAGLQAIVPPSSPDHGDPESKGDRPEDPFEAPHGLTGAAQESLATKPELEVDRVREQMTRERVKAPPTRSAGPRPVGRPRTMPWLLFGLLVVLAGAVIGHWFGIFTIPGLPVRVEPVSALYQSLLSRS